jgi:hypothetical protein
LLVDSPFNLFDPPNQRLDHLHLARNQFDQFLSAQLLKRGASHPKLESNRLRVGQAHSAHTRVEQLHTDPFPSEGLYKP